MQIADSKVTTSLHNARMRDWEGGGVISALAACVALESFWRSGRLVKNLPDVQHPGPRKRTFIDLAVE